MHDALDVAGQFQNVTLVFHGVELIKTDRKGAACIGRIGCRYLLTKAGKQPFREKFKTPVRPVQTPALKNVLFIGKLYRLHRSF
jgi:hypothetical protein